MEGTESMKRVFWALLNLALVGAFVLMVTAVPAVRHIGSSFVSSRTVTVSAEGEALAIPDVAEASFAVVSEGMNPVTLTQENNKKIAAVVEAVKGMGVDAKDVQTTGYNLSPKYSYTDNRQRFDGYTLHQTVTVKFRDFDKAREALGKLPSLGVNQVGGLNLTVDDDDAVLTQARNEAMEKAKAKAQAIAEQGGARLGRLIMVNESGTSRPPVPYYSKAELGMGGGDAALQAANIEPGSQEVRVSVSLTYELD